ncbi:Transcriptional activator CadC [Vibrio mediterranei]|uniref:OmpR/PhoB-type domain-containing protein n=2 Tax=Vibrio mediterranei TaxID=689 RepID=A0ABX5DFN0_9VIBR|nr:winged helix-turn-helix domain-containing protein [Vibrio mediterranei]PCD87836.1 hypothetical protein COR52_13845 [Vibrio mediterranei]PRQ67101.1 hypothetical protein COR51_13300 [Vibrio mediterranei]SBO12066.1 Transcriptional activator CadC [Vibrio mediterranei]
MLTLGYYLAHLLCHMTDLLHKAKAEDSSIRIGELNYNPNSRELSFSGNVVNLEQRTLDILELLLQNVGKPTSAEEIIDVVWGNKYISKNVISNRISTLRSIFKSLDTVNEAHKLLVTYPKKGYFLNREFVSLVPNRTDLNIDPTKPEASHFKLRDLAKFNKNAILVTLIIAALFTYYFLHMTINQTGFSNNNHANSEYISTADIDLLLYSILASDDYSKRYLKNLKFLMMQSQLYNSQINVVNKESPSFYLSAFQEDRYWPGAKDIKHSEYTLNVNINRYKRTNELVIVINIVDNMSKKLSYRYKSIIDPRDIKESVKKINAHIVNFFSIKNGSCYTPQSNLYELTNNPHRYSIDKILQRGYADIDEINYLTPYVLSNTTISNEIVRKWAYLLEASNTEFQRDVDIWLSLLFYRVNDFYNSERYFIKSESIKMIDNSFLYLVRSDISIRLSDENKFLEYYMKSLMSLINIVSAKYVYHRIANLNNSAECLSPWKELDSVLALNQVNPFWINSFTSYCKRASPYLNYYSKPT